MLLKRFSPLIDANPNEADLLWRVAKHLDTLEKDLGNRFQEVEFSLGRLFDISEAGSSVSFAKLTTILIKANIFKKRYVIRSPMGTEILELKSWYDCPTEVYDPLSDVTIEVQDSDVETVFSVAEHGHH